MKKICLICKKEFSVKGKRSITAKYCSVECKNISMKGKIPYVNKKGVCNNTGRTHFKKGQTSEELNYFWKGVNASYSALHHWVKRKLGKPDHCEICGVADDRKYHWANKSGEYRRQLDDYFQVCVPCHKKHDLNRKSLLRKCAFIPVDDRSFYPSGAHIAINSFRRFHQDIDLIVFRQNTIDKLFKEKGINWYQAKPYFAELLFDKYDLIVNFDSDHIFTGRLTEIFDNVNYDVAMPQNLNDYENASLENINEEMYLQAGMVASTRKDFWIKWQEMNKDAMKYVRKENDVVNLLIYNQMPELKLKVLDKKKDYYGCKSLGRELEFKINEAGETVCRGEKVIAYHFARGAVFPKLDIPNMPLADEVKRNWLEIATYGQSETHSPC